MHDPKLIVHFVHLHLIVHPACPYRAIRDLDNKLTPTIKDLLPPLRRTRDLNSRLLKCLHNGPIPWGCWLFGVSPHISMNFIFNNFKPYNIKLTSLTEINSNHIILFYLFIFYKRHKCHCIKRLSNNM